MDPQWRKLLDTVGVSDEQLQDQNTAEFIYEFVEKHGGIQEANRQLEATKNSAPPPPPPGRGGRGIRGGAPRGGGRGAPPPPPPPSGSSGNFPAPHPIGKPLHYVQMYPHSKTFPVHQRLRYGTETR